MSLPKALRQELRLATGDSLQLVCDGEQITLRPARASEHIRKEQDVWVYRSGNPSTASIRKLLKNGREERHRSLVRHNK